VGSTIAWPYVQCALCCDGTAYCVGNFAFEHECAYAYTYAYAYAYQVCPWNWVYQNSGCGPMQAARLRGNGVDREQAEQMDPEIWVILLLALPTMAYVQLTQRRRSIEWTLLRENKTAFWLVQACKAVLGIAVAMQLRTLVRTGAVRR
jgi:hypothetical protein